MFMIVDDKFNVNFCALNIVFIYICVFIRIKTLISLVYYFTAFILCSCTYSFRWEYNMNESKNEMLDMIGTNSIKGRRIALVGRYK